MSARLKVVNPDEKQVFSSEDLIINLDHDLPSLEELGIDENGVKTTEMPDGSVVVDFNPKKTEGALDQRFYANLADKIDDGELDRIANDLITGIEQDILSREEWMQIRRRGIELLGYKLEDPRSDLGTSSAPLEGMATVRHPLLSEAVLRFQANARGELLPASGPVKVRNDVPPAPEGTGYQNVEELATALEIDMNHYLTAVATEYYPDTDRMLFLVGFGGLGVKKVYNCPLRRRPVSESVDAADFIVSNATTDLKSSGRVTHRIKMRPSILKRMQIVGAYRDVDLMLNQAPITTPVEKEVLGTQGIRPATSVQNEQDHDQEIYETYCELDIPGFEHKHDGKTTGLHLPYKVSIHVASRKILEVRRNWLKDDKLCMPREYFVDFPFVPAFGFYPLGFVHIIGNTSITLTAAWREMLDAGMFASFPGFLYSKLAGRQLTNQFRVPPGGGVPIETGNMPLKDMIMPLPYKEPGPSLTAFIQHVEEYGQRLGSTAEMNIGEGKQDAPVGTTLALIEQATKLMDAVHKRLHASQAKEFQLLKERFKEDPEAFWRHNKKTVVQWQKDQFLQALDNYNIVPVADPNNPTSLHRIAKATAIKQLQAASPELYDAMAVDKRIMKIVGVDPEGLFLPEPAPPPPDPRMEAITAKMQQERERGQREAAQAQIKAVTALQTSQDKAADRESRERIEDKKIELEKLRVLEEQIIHQHDEERAQAQMQHSMALKQQDSQMKLQQSQMQHDQKMQHMQQQNAMKLHLDQQKNQMQVQSDAAKMQQDHQMGQMKLAQDAEMHQEQMNLMRQQTDDKVAESRRAADEKHQQSQAAHQTKLEQSRESHAEKLKQTGDMNKAKIDLARKQAAIKPKPPKGKK